MPKRIDAKQREITLGLRKAGCSVLPIHTLGKGAPDLLVGRIVSWTFEPRRNYLLEVKDGDKPPSKRRLTPDEQRFHDSWKGQLCIVKNLDEALAAVGINAAESAGIK